LELNRSWRFLPPLGYEYLRYLCEEPAPKWWHYENKRYHRHLSKEIEARNFKVYMVAHRNDVIRAMTKTEALGNASIVKNEYVCTVPIELNNFLNDLLAVSEKYGFISAKILNMENKWTP
jgi:hypothetical protein